MNLTRTLPAAVVAALALPGVAVAHVSVSPDTVQGGSFKKLEVRVPSESTTEDVVELSVQMPPGVTEVEDLGAGGGWEAELEESGGEIRTVTWTGGRIGPGEVRDFPVRVRIPRGAETLTFKAVERYDGGKVSRWIGPPGSVNEAPVVTVSGEVPVRDEPDAEAAEPTATAPAPATTDAPSVGGAQAPATTTPQDVVSEAEPDATTDDDDGGGIGALGVLGIVLAVAALGGFGYALSRARSARS